MLYFVILSTNLNLNQFKQFNIEFKLKRPRGALLTLIFFSSASLPTLWRMAKQRTAVCHKQTSACFAVSCSFLIYYFVSFLILFVYFFIFSVCHKKMEEHKEQDTSLDAEVPLVPLEELLLEDNENETTPTAAETETPTSRTKAGNETQTPMCVSCTKQCCKCGFRKFFPYFSWKSIARRRRHLALSQRQIVIRVFKFKYSPSALSVWVCVCSFDSWSALQWRPFT